jgi:UDP-3-O-[3-hydroxymyristoyl] glucosamine N-acyltransferase
MADPRFYDNSGPLTLDEVGSITGAQLASGTPGARIADVAGLDSAEAGQLAFCDSKHLGAVLTASKGTAFIVTPALASIVPAGAAYFVSESPVVDFAKVATRFYPDSGLTWPRDRPPVAAVDPTATVGEGSVIAPGAFLGCAVEIGRNTTIGHGAVIGRGVKIGDDCRIGPNVTVSHAMIGDRVIVHPGACIGQDGFKFAPTPTGHQKVPQLGRVRIGDDVEIGANSCIDRGGLADTVVGRGTKIDNLVQIGHNAQIGQHCFMCGQVGISGSVTLGDWVGLGGQVGVGDHRTIASTVQVAGGSAVLKNLTSGNYGGYPAVAIGEWMEGVKAVRRLARKKPTDPTD